MCSMSKGDAVKMTSLESTIQSSIIMYAESRGWLCAKITSPSMRGMPDLVAVRAGRTVWIEVKREDEEARRQQKLRAKEMRAHDAEVFEVDTFAEAREILK